MGPACCVQSFQLNANPYIVTQVKMRNTGNLPPLHYTSCVLLNWTQDTFIFSFILSQYRSVHKPLDGNSFLNTWRENIAAVYWNWSRQLVAPSVYHFTHKHTIIFQNWLVGHKSRRFILDSMEWDLTVIPRFEYAEASKEHKKWTSSAICCGTRKICIHFRAESIIPVFHYYIAFISWFVLVLTSFTISPVCCRRCHFREQ